MDPEVEATPALPPGPGFLARLGALCSSPRRLARRDLDRNDGKAVDDLIAFSLIVLVLGGAGGVARAVLAAAAGRTNTAVHRLLDVLQPAGPLIALWLVSALALWIFTVRSGRRAVGELAARVITGFLLANMLVTPLVARLDVGRARFVLESLPWAVAALLFGLVLREAVEPLSPPDAPPMEVGFPSRARQLGVVVALLVLAAGVRHVRIAVKGLENDVAIEAKRGALAPAIDLPLVGPGELHLAQLRGRRVVLTFWATWCGPCMEELPQLEQAFRGRTAESALVYAINVDEAGPNRERAVRDVVQRFGLTMPVALDDGTASAAYSITSIPTLVRVDTDGKLLGVFERPLDRAALRDAIK